ncbi:hypothetical protein [Larkinella terrae]|uniref:Uncharacterized protein n=1 Tax=Larkinella terrae TaxID=2025311 RepID=A0A7K0EUF3_9BACT|nr:hypothetical protein [Larkinella terrae]MRS65443.1 hypothetical protein [Larkinella terrae]
MVTEIVRYEQHDTNQQEINRQTFGYETGRLASYTDQNPDRALSFKFKYVGGKVAYAYTADHSTVLNFDYDQFERIEKASLLVNNKEQTVFSLNYESPDRTTRLTGLVETRILLPANSSIISRTFQFSYQEIAGKTEDLVIQTVQNAYKDGSRTEEEFDFDLSAQNHSPYYDSGQTIVFALLALTNPNEVEIARYLQRFDCQSVTHEIMNTGGNRSLREYSQFTTDFDGNYNPIRSSQQTTITIPTDSPNRYYQQTFQFNCVE